MKKASLRPYPGSVWLCNNQEEFRKLNSRLTGIPYEEKIYGGLETLIEHPKHGYVFLVYAESNIALVHELGHVVLDLFTNVITGNPTECNGEPFCYLLETLYQELAGFEDDK